MIIDVIVLKHLTGHHRFYYVVGKEALRGVGIQLVAICNLISRRHLILHTAPLIIIKMILQSTRAQNKRGCYLFTELQYPARSTLLMPVTFDLKTFIFSTKVVRAVSVASPTFSYTPLAWNKIRHTHNNFRRQSPSSHLCTKRPLVHSTAFKT